MFSPSSGKRFYAQSFRQQRSPFVRNRFSCIEKRTPTKRGFPMPVKKREKRTPGLSCNLQVSQIADGVERWRVELFGASLPVLITEALTSAERSSAVTVKIDPSGWAWIVKGRKLVVWRYKSTPTKGVQCKELTLPASDLAYSACQVCVLPAIKEGLPTACLVVSPEGVVRYWPNIAYEASTLEVNAELKGEECACVVSFLPYGCLMSTTTSSLLLLTVVKGQNNITCAALKTSQSMFSGIGRRMSSFIFGSLPAQTAAAPFRALLPGKKDTGDCFTDCRPFYVLTDAKLQKWTMPSVAHEKILYEADVMRMFRDALAVRLWQQETASLLQFRVWLLDVQHFRDGLVILAACVNTEAGNILYYATGTLSTEDDSTPDHLNTLTVLDYTEIYEVSVEEQLSTFCLLVPNTACQEMYVYNRKTVLVIPVEDADQSSKIESQTAGDQVIGAGTCNGEAIFFSGAHGMFSVKSLSTADESYAKDFGETTYINLDQSTMVFNYTNLADLSSADDKMSRLKACFISSLAGNQSDVERELSNMFPISGADDGDSVGSDDLDRLVSELSASLMDDVPTVDPRWAESRRSDGSGSSSMIIVQQLRDKVRALDYFRSFLKRFHLWNRLSMVSVRDTNMSTRMLLCEHVEKLEAAVSLRQQSAEQTQVLDACIVRLLKHRGEIIPNGLSPEDVFFQRVSAMHEIADMFLDYEEEELLSGMTSTQAVKLIININGLLQEMVSSALVYRHTGSKQYQRTDGGTGGDDAVEHVPWTSTSGPYGIRTVLSKQISLIVERGLLETEDSGLKGTLCRQLMGLVDLQLDGYRDQLDSSRPPQPTEQHSQPCSTLQRLFEDERGKLIGFLFDCGQCDIAASLAEKYCDFDMLIRFCEASSNQQRLQRYITQFADQGFSKYLFDWYLKQGKRSRLLADTFAHNPELRNFLTSTNTQYLSWLHEIGTGDFNAAHQTLMNLALQEEAFLSKKKTLLSLSKLSALATEDDCDNLIRQVEAIDEELGKIGLQEDLPADVLTKIGMDQNNMKVLSTSELIQLYTNGDNEAATEIDFRKALDLLLYLDQNDAEYEELNLYIWCQAILRDKARWLDPSINDADAIRMLLLFRTVDLLHDQGEEPCHLPPSCEILLRCEQLGEMRHNPHFQFALKAGFELIADSTVSFPHQRNGIY